MMHPPGRLRTFFVFVPSPAGLSMAPALSASTIWCMMKGSVMTSVCSSAQGSVWYIYLGNLARSQGAMELSVAASATSTVRA